jgi:hypothetical protein
MSFRLNLLLPREPDENAQISGRSILDLGRIIARRTIAEQQADNEIEIRLKTETGSISKNIKDLPRITINGKQFVKKGYMHNFRERRLPIWIHGFSLIEIPLQKKYWACKLCDDIGHT